MCNGDPYNYATVTCPSGLFIARIEFASYGTPSGSCGAYVQSSCHSALSRTFVESVCLAKPSCDVSVMDENFGDPCAFVYKYVYVQAVCTPPSPPPPPAPPVAPLPPPTPSGLASGLFVKRQVRSVATGLCWIAVGQAVMLAPCQASPQQLFSYQIQLWSSGEPVLSVAYGGADYFLGNAGGGAAPGGAPGPQNPLALGGMTCAYKYVIDANAPGLFRYVQSCYYFGGMYEGNCLNQAAGSYGGYATGLNLATCNALDTLQQWYLV